MADELDDVAGQILRNYRHLMTEAERRADRAFVFQQRLQGAAEAAKTAELTAAMQQALDDPWAAELFARGRPRFLRELARRIVAEHGPTLPHCDRCGGVLKTPSAKQCFTCDFSWPQDGKDRGGGPSDPGGNAPPVR